MRTDAHAFGVGVGRDGRFIPDVHDGETADVVELLALGEGDIAGDWPHGEDVDGVLVEALKGKALHADGVLEIALGGVGRRAGSGGRRLEGRGVGVFGGGRGGEKGRFGEGRGVFGFGDTKRREIDGGRFEVEELLLEVDEVFVVSVDQRRERGRTSSLDGRRQRSRSASNCPFRGRFATMSPPSSPRYRSLREPSLRGIAGTNPLRVSPASAA